MRVVAGRSSLLDVVYLQDITGMALTSPCISVCQIDPNTGICLGCYRSRKEIAKWPAMSTDEQADLLQVLKHRRAEKTGLYPRQTRRGKQK